MDSEIIKIAGGVAGIGGVSAACVVFVFRSIISEKFLPQLTKEKAFKLLMTIVGVSALMGLSGIAAWTYTTAVATDPTGVTLQVDLVGPHHELIRNAKVWSSRGKAVQDSDGRWEIEIPPSKTLKRTSITVYADQKEESLTGESSAELTGETTQALQVQLIKNETETVSGVVEDSSGHPIGSAKVYVVPRSAEGVSTNEHGEFELPAHASNRQSIRICIEKTGYDSTQQDVEVGSGPVTLHIEPK